MTQNIISRRKRLKRFLMKFPYIGTYLKFCTVPTFNRSLYSYLKFWLSADKRIYWPREKGNHVTAPQNITIGYNSSIGGSGSYIQGMGKLIIGNNVQTGRNVGFISGSHGIYNQFTHDNKTTIIGDYCWIGMGAIILPGVELGIRTVVGAGSVVTKSFPEGYCVIAGNPAKKIKDIDPGKFVPHDLEYRFYGYVPEKQFEKFKKKHLKK